MADDSQDVGTGTALVFAGDTLRLLFTTTTGGSAAGVSAASYRIAKTSPVEKDSPTVVATKTLGSGITTADGTVSGTVDVNVVLQPSDTAGLSGDYYHQLDLTVSGDEAVVARGTIRLQPGL